MTSAPLRCWPYSSRYFRQLGDVAALEHPLGLVVRLSDGSGGLPAFLAASSRSRLKRARRFRCRSAPVIALSPIGRLAMSEAGLRRSPTLGGGASPNSLRMEK